MHRIVHAQNEARARAQALLGVSTKSVKCGIPDPFDSSIDASEAPQSSASHRSRLVKARWSELVAQAEARRGEQIKAGKEINALKERIASQRMQLEERRTILDQAWRMLDIESSSDKLHPTGVAKESRQKDIVALRERILDLSSQLARAREHRQQQMLEIFYVRSPSGEEVSRFPSTKILPFARSRYRLAPFDRAERSPFESSSSESALTTIGHDWTILPFKSQVSLPLPTASDIRRFPRKDINVATAVVAQLLQMNANICGVALPFSLGIDKKGRWAIKPDQMWAGAAPESKHSLHLGQSAYDFMANVALRGAARAKSMTAASHFSRSGIEQSVLSLGASTLATLESFVQLPGRGHSSWGRASVLQREPSAQSQPAEHDLKGAKNIHPGIATEGADSIDRKEESEMAAARHFCRALVMLAFDASYFAWTQGCAVDLITAGENTLKLIHEAARASGRRKKSHTSLQPSETLQDFSFPLFEFSKLLQLHETSAHSGAHGSGPVQVATGKNTRLNEQIQARTIPANNLTSDSRIVDWSSSQQQTHATHSTKLEESYVDAGLVAASLPDVRSVSRASPSSSPAIERTQRSTNDRNRSHSSASAAPKDRQVAPVSHQTARAPAGVELHHSGVQPAVIPGSLDFLRRRSKKVAKEAGRVSLNVSPDVAIAKQSRGDCEGQTSSKKAHPVPTLQAKDEDRAIPASERRTASGGPGGGGVFFNGREIGLSETDSADSSDEGLRRAARRIRRASSSKKSAKEQERLQNAKEDSEEWDVL